MSELRQDPLTGTWVIVARGRGARPDEFGATESPTPDADQCPFCPGREDRTTPEILATGRPDGGVANRSPWRVRVFPNLYPALRAADNDTLAVESSFPGEGSGESAGALLTLVPGHGDHEVVNISPDHRARPATLTIAEWTELLEVLRTRTRALEAKPGNHYVVPFCNHGPYSGATLSHPHMQIIATPVVPVLPREKLRRLLEYRRTHGSCLVCDLIGLETETGERVVSQNKHWVAVAPWASRFPWEMLLLPRRHGSGLGRAGSEELAGLAEIMSRCLAGLERIQPGISLNLVFHGAPLAPTAPTAYGSDQAETTADLGTDPYHWHVEILPRATRLAGFEIGTGFAINSTAPEVAAARLRKEGC